MNNLNPIFNFPLLLEAVFSARKLFRPVRVVMNDVKKSGKTGKKAFKAIDAARNRYLAAAEAQGKRAEAEAYLTRRMATTDVQRLKDLNLQNAKWTSPTPAPTSAPRPAPAPAAPTPTPTPTPAPAPAAPTPTPTPAPSPAPAAPTPTPTPTPTPAAQTPQQIAAQQAAALNASRSRARHYAFGQLTRTTGDVINGTVGTVGNTLKHLGYATAGTVGAAGLGTGYLAYNALQN